jgi:hypothetical protein
LSFLDSILEGKNGIAQTSTSSRKFVPADFCHFGSASRQISGNNFQDDVLVKPDSTMEDYFPRFSWNKSHFMDVSSDPVLLVDPTYLTEVFNEESDDADYVRRNGLYLFDFGGDWFGPLWQWKSFLIMATSHHYEVYPSPPTGAKEICASIGCDSATLILLPVTDNISKNLKQKIDECLEQRIAVLLKLAKGRWEFKFEQFDSPKKKWTHLYRNIILQHKPSGRSRTTSCFNINPHVASTLRLRVRKELRPKM